MAKVPGKSSTYLLITNIGQLLTLKGDAAPRYALQEAGLIEDAAVFRGGGKIIATRSR